MLWINDPHSHFLIEKQTIYIADKVNDLPVKLPFITKSLCCKIHFTLELVSAEPLKENNLKRPLLKHTKARIHILQKYRE